MPVNPHDKRDRDKGAEIRVKPLQAQYLNLEIYGGVRRAGDYASLTSGILIPGPGAPLDKFGNLPRNYVSRVLRAKSVFWWKSKKSRKPMLVRRDGEHLKVIAIIADRADYEPKFDFFGIIERGATKHLAEEVSRALDKAGRIKLD